MKRGLRGFLIRVGVSLLAIGAIIFSFKDKLSEAITILTTEVSWPWFAVGAVVYFGGLVLLSVRLRQVLEVQRIHVSFGETLYLNFIGLFFNLFLPSAVGGDIAKAYYASKHTGKKIASTTSIVIDRLMGFVALILMAFAAVSIFHKEFNDPRVSQIVFVFLGVMMLITLFLGSKRFASIFNFAGRWIPKAWREKISDIYHAIYGYRKHKMTLFNLVALSFAGQCLFILSHYFLTLGVGVKLEIWIFFILIPVIGIISMAPSLGGLGVREAGMIYLFKSFMPSERALALSLLLDMLIYGFSLLGGLIFLIKGELKMKNIHEMEKLHQNG